MEIIVGKTAGFCFGVKNAVTKVEEELDKSKEVYCLGELVHNNKVTGNLTAKGAIFIEDVEEAKGKVVIRSHGVTKETYEKAKELNLEILDLTCPKVLHIHKIAEEYTKKGYYIFVIGKKEHPEMLGTVSFCGDEYSVIEKEEDINIAIEKYQKSKLFKALVIAQTTYSMEKFNRYIEKIQEKISLQNLEIKNTICSATKQRQEETEAISKKVDGMIIVGGKHSSNSTKLYELAKKHCKKVIFIEDPKEIEVKSVENLEIIGIMAGASTPKESIEKTVEKVREIC